MPLSSGQAFAAGGESAAQPHTSQATAAASGTTSTASFSRSGSDRIREASLPGIGTVTPSYDATYGHVTALDGGTYSLSTTHDAYSGKPLTQTLVQTGDSGVKTTLSNASNSYDALGRRIKRTVDGGQLSPATVGTDYWYGPLLLKPLAVKRQDGTGNKKGRVIYLGDEVLAIESGQGSMQASYPVADHLGSTRAVLDGDGNTSYSLGYDDWGKTTISGQASAVDVSDLSLLFRFQGIEQDIFPLTTLGVDSTGALAWLDGIGLYHYYGRDYATGLAAFLAKDLADASVSPYSAFAASPANYIDPDGMAPKKPKKKARPPLSHDSLEGLIAFLRQLGVTKVMIGEKHHDPYSGEVVGRVLEGAAFNGQPFRFWRELIGLRDQHLNPIDAILNPETLKNPKHEIEQVRENLVDDVMLLYYSGIGAEKIKNALLSPQATYAILDYARPKRQDLDKYITYPGFGVAVTGAFHAVSALHSKDYTYMLWDNSVLLTVPHQYSALSIQEQQDMLAGFIKLINLDFAQNKNTTSVLLIPGTIFNDKELNVNRTKFDHFWKNIPGLTMFEFPLSVTSAQDARHASGYNVTVIASYQWKNEIWAYIRNMTYPHAVNFNCTGLPDCPEPAKEEPKDEL